MEKEHDTTCRCENPNPILNYKEPPSRGVVQLMDGNSGAQHGKSYQAYLEDHPIS